MFWAAIHCYNLQLDLALRAQTCELPLALCAGPQVLQVSPAARLLGICPGQRRATALSIAPALHLIEHQPVNERNALEQVATWLLQFTPNVSLQAPDGIVMDLHASLRLFGGREHLVARLRSGLSSLGFSAHLSTAPTATAAWLLARWQDARHIEHESQLVQALAPVPIGLMTHAAEHTDALAAVGIRHFGDLARLPRMGVARRYGAALLVEIDTALGRQAEPRRWFKAPDHFSVRLELLARVEQAEGLLFGAQRLLRQLCGWLGVRHLATQEVLLRAEHESGRHSHPATLVPLRLAQPSRDDQRLLTVLRERLAVLRLPAPVHTLHLSCERTVALSGTHGELFPGPDTERNDLAQLIERLQSRLGREQVQRLHGVADHRPEAAYRTAPIDPSSPTRHIGTAPLTTGGMPRPVWLLSTPLPLTEHRQRPCWHGPLTLLAGPERIETGWWDAGEVRRDYFIAEDPSAGWVWIFRTLTDSDTSGWFLQGVFG
jgi:protein ImuB